MFLHISDQMTIAEVEERFNDCFPHLQILFFEKHCPASTSQPLTSVNKNHRIEAIRRYHFNGVLEIKSWFTAAKVKNDLQEMFDLNAEIFSLHNGQRKKLNRTENLLRKAG